MKSIGIDLGTTNSVLSYLEAGRPVALPVGGSPIVPSVVLVDGERVIVGREARNLELLHPETTIRSVKRRMGTAYSYSIGEKTLSPEQVSAEILRALAREAERALGEPIHEVVITVPAYFDDAQRRATLRAGELASLQVLRLLNEPTSASLCYGAVGAVGRDEPELVLVYDLGGGTFDVSVLEVFGDVREVRATAGNTRLGGDDFDDKLVAEFVEQLKREHAVDPREDPRAMARLRRIAEQTKIALSTEVRIDVREEFVAEAFGRAVHLELELTRRHLEGLIRPMLDSTMVLTERALRDAGVTREQLSAVCLVGGSTRIPLVRALLEEHLGAPVHEEVDPDLAVGLGASVQAAMLRGEPVDRVLVDVAAHSLGIRVIGSNDDWENEPDTFAPILKRNTVLPSSRAEEFYTCAHEQETLLVEVFQGESVRVSENAPVGSFRCPLEPKPANSPVRVEFAYDLNGIVRVTVSQPGVEAAKTVALRVADAGQRNEQGIEVPASAIERRAEQLLGALGPDQQKDLRMLLETFRAARGAARAQAEEALLDFFADQELEEESPLPPSSDVLQAVEADGAISTGGATARAATTESKQEAEGSETAATTASDATEGGP